MGGTATRQECKGIGLVEQPDVVLHVMGAVGGVFPVREQVCALVDDHPFTASPLGQGDGPSFVVRAGFAAAAAVLDGDLKATELFGELGALLERELLGGPAEDGALPGIDLRALEGLVTSTVETTPPPSARC